MTLPQALSFAIIAAMMALFVWGRLRYDLVALLALLAAIAAGIVPFDKAFSGFSDDIVIIVACALLVSAAVARSGMIEDALRPHRALSDARAPSQVAVLVGTVTVLSAFVKNIGALAMLMPVAFQLARKTNSSPSHLPDADGVRLAARRHRHAGRHLAEHHRVAACARSWSASRSAMFDFTPVGLGLAVARRDLPRLRLAAAAARPQGRRLDGRGLQPRGLHHRGERAGGLAAGRQDDRRARSARRGRGRGVHDRARPHAPPRAGRQHRAQGRRHPADRGRAGRAGAGGRRGRASSSRATRRRARPPTRRATRSA